MACNSDYMEQSELERRLQETAQLYVFAASKLKVDIPEWVTKQASCYYASNKQIVPMLCDLIGSMNETQLDTIVYNARDKMARRLADWWEEHQEADRKRIAAEKKEQREREMKQKALKKLTKKEKQILGLKD